jgi:purine-binding chemotaxis protein CheW
MISIDELPQLHSDSALVQTQSTESLRVCLVTLGEKTFAIDLRQVIEVFEPESITPVPGMPAWLVGVTNLRGTIIPLADVRVALAVSVSVPPKYAVVVRHGAQQVGLLVEDVPEIHTFQSDALVTTSDRTADNRLPLFSGSFKTEKNLSAILEMSRLLAFIEERANAQNP